MTDNQKEFIRTLYKYGEMTSEECCKKLNIEKTYSNTHYSELCFFLPYPNEEDDFDSKIHLLMFSLEEDPLNERAIFSLTSAGKIYVEEKWEKKKVGKHTAYQSVMATVAVIVAIIGVVIAIISVLN